MLILISYIALWIFLYYLEGFHDAFITLETNEHPPAKDFVKVNYFKGKWHVYDSYSYAIFHIGFALLFALLTSDSRLLSGVEARLTTYDYLLSSRFLLLTSSLIAISVSLRMILHDMFFDIGMKRKLFIVPTCQGSWDFWDCWLVKLNNLHPILPFFLRFAPITISLVIYIFFFINGC